MALFPIFLKLDGRQALVVGGGRVGEGKVRGLLRAGARVRVVAPGATARVQAWAKQGRIVWSRRAFAPEDLRGAALAVVATPFTELNDRVARLARSRRVPVNVVDDPDRCDFYYPSVVRRGPLTIAISTEGRSPAFARRLRVALERSLDSKLGAEVRRLGRERRRLFSQSLDPRERRRLLLRLAGELPLGGNHGR